MIRTVLITGIAGFVGSHLVERLLDEGIKIIGLKRSGTDLWRIEHISGRIALYDVDNLEQAFSENKIDCVIHLATCYIKHHTSFREVEQMVDTNITLPSKLCQLASQYGVRYFINTGTFFEYTLGKKEPLVETDKQKAYNFYASTKIAFSDILRFFVESGQLTVVDFKLFAPFGEKDNEKLVLFLIKSLLSGTHIDFSGGEQCWNFTYVGDIVEAYVLALEKMSELSERYTTINVGYDKALTIQEMVEKLEGIAGKRIDIKWGAKPYIANEIFYANCDNTKLKKVLGWQQKFDVDSGLKKTFEYYKQTI